MTRSAFKVRALAEADLDAVVAIDVALSGRSRRAYFERRLRAGRREPQAHVQFAVDADGKLAGYIFGRVVEGEFGRSDPELRLETLGVRPASQGLGIGAALGEVFEREAGKRRIPAIRTTALWREHGMLALLDRARYVLARNHVLDCALAEAELGSAREQPVEGEEGDFEHLARDSVEVALLKEGDLEGVARIDRRHTGRDRTPYLRNAMAEALGDSAVRISLAARVEGDIAGFLMARVDLGDFGRAEPVAVIDTIGVDPMRARKGIGRALLSQLFVNLRALGVERVETAVAPGNIDLIGFFYTAGLKPSERLAFVKRLA
jgi:ribosomal protein S18 acetylase RimI-like enzyme